MRNPVTATLAKLTAMMAILSLSACSLFGGNADDPIEDLRECLTELPLDKEVWLVCGVGQRAYYALRLLLQSGYKAKFFL